MNPAALYMPFPSKEAVLFEIARTDHQHALACIGDVRHRTDDAFRHTIARGVADELFSPVDGNRVVRALLSLSIDLVRWYGLDGHDSPEELGQFYTDLALARVGRSHDGNSKSGRLIGRRPVSATTDMP